MKRTSFPKTRSHKQLAVLGLAAAMALPAGVGMISRVRAAEAPTEIATPTANPSGLPTVILAADTAGMSDADKLKEGVRQYGNGQFEEAVATLQSVKKESLTDDEKKQLDDSLKQADSAAQERKAARAEFEKGQEALNGNN